MIVKARGKVTASDLAKEFELSERTIHRDMSELLLWGVPLITDTGPGGGYSLPEGYSVDPEMFTTEEAIALATGSIAIKQFSDFWDNPREVELTNTKLLAALSDREREFVVKHLKYIYFDHSRWYRSYKSQEALSDLKDAVVQDRQVLLEFFERDEDIETSDPKISLVDPYGLVFKSDTWYLCGYHHTERKLRRWNLTRVVHIKLTNSTFTRPKDFVLKDWWEKGVEEFGKGKTIVLMTIDNTAWYRFKRFQWKIEDKIKELDTYRLVEMAVDKYDWLIDLVLVNRGEVQILQPEELRQKIAKLTERIYSRHLSSEYTLLLEEAAVDFEILSLSGTDHD